MRKLPILIALCALVVVLLLWLGKERPDNTVAGPTGPGREPVSDLTLETASSLSTADAQSAEARQPASEVLPGDSSSESFATCVVLGRVVDENDQPLPGVVARLSAYRAWAEGVDAPRLSGKLDMRGWETTTGVDGGFRFEVSRPPAERAVLTLKGDPFQDSAQMWFGSDHPKSKAALQWGRNDLGTIRLVATGAVRGSVRDESGAPLADVELSLGQERGTTISREGISDAAGQFVIAHAPAGPIGVKTQKDGYLSEFRKPIVIEAGRYTEPVEFVLRPAPTLRGVVVDDLGLPIDGVKLWGWPQGSGSGAGAKTAGDGTFTIQLPQEEPYTLEAEIPGFEPFGVDDRSKHYLPGTSDLRIVMKRLGALTLQVVDKSSGRAITRFGHEVLAGMSIHAPRRYAARRRRSTPRAESTSRSARASTSWTWRLPATRPSASIRRADPLRTMCPS